MILIILSTHFPEKSDNNVADLDEEQWKSGLLPDTMIHQVRIIIHPHPIVQVFAPIFCSSFSFSMFHRLLLHLL